MWAWLNKTTGTKTNAGALLQVVTTIAAAFDLLPAETIEALSQAAAVIMSVGLADKARVKAGIGVEQ